MKLLMKLLIRLFRNCFTCRHSCKMSCAGGGKPSLRSHYGFRRFRYCSLAAYFRPRRNDEVRWYGICGYYEFSPFNSATFVDYDNKEVVDKILGI